MTSLILPSADTAMMNLFLAQVAEDFANYFIVMQVDQAGWHRAKDLHVPENIRLIFQPAYSPEVNPVEHLWEEVREKYLHNRIFPSLEDLIEVLCQALTELTEDVFNNEKSITFLISFLTSQGKTLNKNLTGEQPENRLFFDRELAYRFLIMHVRRCHREQSDLDTNEQHDILRQASSQTVRFFK